MVKVRVGRCMVLMCGISRKPYSERLPVFDGHESACTTFVATFPRVISDELTAF